MANTPIPYDYVRLKLKASNPLDISRKSGTDYDPYKREFTVSLMERKYIVQYPSGKVYNQNYSEINDFAMKTLIIRYLIHAQGVPPTGKDINYRDVPGGQVYYRNFYGRCILRLARMFGGNIPALTRAMENVNGVKVSYGDISYRFQFLNNVYITFILWTGDEEFPPGANILFDANVTHYFDAEDLAVVGDISLNILREVISPTADKS